MSNYIILLPPSEGKVKGGDNNSMSLSFSNLDDKREFIINHIENIIPKLSEVELEKTFELKGNKLFDSVETMSNLKNEKTMSAINRYSGVMFKSIKFLEMTNEQKERFNSNIIFVDGLFGILKPSDLIPDYKLKINSKVSGLDITKYWKDNLSDILKKILKDKIVIDILPQAHRKVVDYSSAKEVYKIIFAELKDGKLKQAGHMSKELKGEIVNYLCLKDSLSKKDLEEFYHSYGFKYSKEYSTSDEIIYLKN